MQTESISIHEANDERYGQSQKPVLISNFCTMTGQVPSAPDVDGEESLTQPNLSLNHGQHIMDETGRCVQVGFRNYYFGEDQRKYSSSEEINDFIRVSSSCSVLTITKRGCPVYPEDQDVLLNVGFLPKSDFSC